MEPGSLKIGEKYYQVNSYGMINGFVWRNTAEDNCRFSRGDVSKTSADAQFNEERRKVEFELKQFAAEYNQGWEPDWDNVKQTKWSLWYSRIAKCLQVDYVYNTDIGLVLFKDEEFILYMPEELKQRLIKYKFGVK